MNTGRRDLLGVFAAFWFLWGWAGGAVAQPLKVPEGMKSRFEIQDAVVLKVFSATDDDHRFVAYLIEWRDSEVIVSDDLGRSDFKVGDTITFMVHRMGLPSGPLGKIEALSFRLMPAGAGATPEGPRGDEGDRPEDAHRLQALIGGDLEAAENETERFYALNRASRNALAAGKTDLARTLAVELEELAEKHKDDWNYGNAIQDAHQVLGRIALAEGDLSEAKRRLLASADSRGSPQMNSFGPNMRLAKELLEHGESKTVIAYFDRCGEFWEMGAERLDAWKQRIRDGGIPDFGANLHY